MRVTSHMHGFTCRKLGIKTRPLLNIIAEKLSGETQFKLAHDKLLAVEQRHKQLVQEVCTYRHAQKIWWNSS